MRRATRSRGISKTCVIAVNHEDRKLRGQTPDSQVTESGVCPLNSKHSPQPSTSTSSFSIRGGRRDESFRDAWHAVDVLGLKNFHPNASPLRDYPVPNLLSDLLFQAVCFCGLEDTLRS